MLVIFPLAAMAGLLMTIGGAGIPTGLLISAATDNMLLPLEP